jgi:outer membrane protein TolC
MKPTILFSIPVLLSGLSYAIEVDFSDPSPNPDSRRVQQKIQDEKMGPMAITIEESPISYSAGDDDVIDISLTPSSQEYTTEPTSAPKIPREPISITPKGLVREVILRNSALTVDRLQIKINRERENVERYIFEPIFSAKWEMMDMNSPTEAADTLAKGGNPQFDQFEERMNTTFAGLLSGGGDWSLEFNHNRTQGTSVKSFKDYKTEYDALTKFTLRQPLWKGLGSDVTLGEYRKARLDSSIHQGNFDKRLMHLVEQTLKTYWKYYGGIKLLDSLTKSVELTQESVELLESRLQKGESSELEVLEAKSGLATRRLEMNAMKAKVQESKNNILEYLDIPSEWSHKLSFIPGEDDVEIKAQNLEEVLERALDQLPDLKIALDELEKSKIDYHLSKDDLDPQFDVVGSTWLTQLNSSEIYDKMFENEFVSWQVGVEFSMPIAGGKKERSALEMSKLKAEQNQHRLISLKRQIKIALQNTLSKLNAAELQEKDLLSSYQIKKQIFDIEREKLRLGESQIRNVLDKEEDMIDEQRRWLNRVIEVKFSQIALGQLSGDLLKLYAPEGDLTQTTAWQEFRPITPDTFLP